MPALAARVLEVAARREPQLLAPPAAARAADRRLAVGVVGHRQHEVDALQAEQRVDDPGHQLVPAVAVQDVDLRGAGVRAHRDLRSRRLAGAGGGSTPSSSNAPNRSISASTRDCEWSEQTMTAWSSRNASGPPAGVHQALELAVGGGQRLDLGERPVLVRVRVVVGQREEQEVEQVVLDQVLADAARVLVADPRQAELGAARRLARGEDVGVEELLRPVHRVAEDRARDPGQRGVGRHARGGGGRGTSGTSCRRCARPRRRAARTPSARPWTGARGSCCRSCR